MTRFRRSTVAAAALVGVALVLPEGNAHADTGRLNAHLDVGFGAPVIGEARRRAGTDSPAGGGAAWLGLDVPLSDLLALEFLGGGGGFAKPLPGSGLLGTPFATFVGGVRLRFLDAQDGYANERRASLLGNVWASSHVGYVFFDERQFGLDVAGGVELSVVRPLSLGVFARMVLAVAGRNDGPDGFLVVGLSAGVELVRRPPPPDTDGDGLNDEEEAALGTDPAWPDTDHDGLPDGLEVATGTNPRSDDTDGDGLLDGHEDRNRNGRVDPGEEDPRVPTRRDEPATGTTETPQGTGAAERPAGSGMPLPELRFAEGRSSLLEGSDEALDRAAAHLRGESGVFEIAVYVAGSGDLAADARLSQRRAEVVMNGLVQRGIPRARLVARGYGAADPVAPNDTPENRARNERVILRRAAE